MKQESAVRRSKEVRLRQMMYPTYTAVGYYRVVSDSVDSMLPSLTAMLGSSLYLTNNTFRKKD